MSIYYNRFWDQSLRKYFVGCLTYLMQRVIIMLDENSSDLSPLMSMGQVTISHFTIRNDQQIE